MFRGFKSYLEYTVREGYKFTIQILTNLLGPRPLTRMYELTYTMMVSTMCISEFAEVNEQVRLFANLR